MPSGSPSCTVCKDLDETIAEDYQGVITFAERVTFSQLKGASSSCPICCLIFRGVDRFIPDWIEAQYQAKDKVTVKLWTNKAVGTLECHVIFQDYGSLREADILRPAESRGTALLNEILEFYTPQDQEPPWKAFGKARKLLSPTYSAFQEGGLVHDWLGDCLANHSICRTTGPQALPTRVIDVLGNEQSRGAPFLYESRGEVAPYICLSYCWGDNPAGFLTTTSITLEQRKNGIGLEEFPPVFADALWVAKSLGVRYLWIDSLCIVQDNPKDWARESGAMSTIYGNSYLTIAASEAPNAMSGMFYALDDSGTELNTIRVTAVRPDNTQASISVRERIPTWNEVGASPLSLRGWTFQEGILPKRVIQLGLYEPQWECNVMSACCCIIKPQSNGELKRGFSLATGATAAMSQKERWKLWSDIVSEYTSRALTKGTDKLVALSGVAKSLQAIWKCRYVAGLWEDELLMGLCWQLDGRGRRYPRPTPFRAPTWSWASTDNTICISSPYYPKGNFFQMSVISVRCDLATDDPTGAVSGGQLTVSGKLIKAEYIYASHSLADPFNGSIVFDSLYIGGQNFTVKADVDLTRLTCEGIPDIQEVYCLLLGAFGESIPSPPDFPPAKPREQCSMLILQKCPDDREGFERIGIINGAGDETETWFSGIENNIVTIF